MTIPEEIEQLKIKLEQTADEREQAEVLMEILKKYTLINSTDSEPDINRLFYLAEKLNEPIYKAWGLSYLASLKRNKAEYDVSKDISQQCIGLFEEIGDKKGIATSYNNIGLIYQCQSNYPEALKNLTAALKILEDIGNKEGVASVLMNIGIIYREECKYELALNNFLYALKIKEQIGSKDNSTIYNSIGIVYENKGNYPESLKYYLEALKIAKKMGNENAIVMCLGNMGNLYIKSENYEEALKVLQSALNYHRYENAIKTNIGIIYFKQGKYKEAFLYHSEALKYSIKIGEKQYAAIAYNNIGWVYAEQGNFEDALQNYFSSLKIEEGIGYKAGIAWTHNKIGEVYEKLGKYNEALKHQLLAIQVAEEIKHKEEIRNAYKAISGVYKIENDFENSLKYFEKYHEVEKEMLGEDSQKQLNNLSFMHNLEQKEKDLEIEQLRNVELKKERDRSEALLLNILPAEVAEELKNKGSADAKLFDEVTVLFTDFKSFTTVSERLSPQQLVDELHACFSAFDEITHRYNIEKIKTVGDAYLAVCGLPLSNIDHAENMIRAAREIRDFMLNRKREIGENTFEVRIGVHSGSVVAGIVGIKKFAYDIWGDTVNTAARMEQNGEAGKVNISEATYELVKNIFACEYRGEVEAKNKGKLKMYFVE